MRGVAWLEALRGARGAPRWAGAAVIALAALMALGVVALRLAVDTPSAAVLVLLCLPVALLAVSFGRLVGLLAATTAFAVTVVYAATPSGSIGGAPGLVSRTVAYGLLGILPGWFADRLVQARAAEAVARQAMLRALDELEEAQRVAGVGSWRWDVPTGRLTLSTQLADLLGYAPDEELSFDEAFAERIHPEEQQAVRAALAEVLRTGGTFELTHRLVLPDGSQRHVLSRGEVLLEGGVATAMRGTAQDITALREAELATAASGARLSQVLETLADGITVTRAVRGEDGAVVDFEVAYINTAACEMLGRRQEDLVGRRWSELWPGRMGTPLFSAYVRLVDTGEPVHLDAVPVVSTGTQGAVAEVVDLHATRLDDGSVTSVRDATQRARMDRALAQAAAQFAAAFDHAPVGMALIRPDGVLLRANEALCAMTGRRLEALVGTPLAGLTDRRDALTARTLLSDLTSGGPGATCRGELRLRTADDEARWISLSMAMVAGDESVYAVAHLEDVHERKRFESRMQYLADHDALTGLYNRRRFHEELAHHHALQSRYGGAGVVVLVDLDNFKYINDTLGHGTGDQLIQAIARMMRSRLRASDVVGRLGGDEFAVLLPGVDVAQAVEVATHLLAGIRTTEVTEAGHRVRSTGSAGVARLDEPSAAGADEILANADLAMYAAKEAGRDTLVVHDPEGPHVARSRARFQWLDRIRHALDNDLFVLRAQPIQDLATGEITGCELLVRMRDGAHLVEPDRFLHVAERHGLAVAIDRVVVSRAIGLAASQDRPPGFRWEINLSGDSLGDPSLPQLIETRIRETGVSPSSLVFEITETAAISNMAEAAAFATRIRGLGCGFALDDFGAGYGSFYYLKHLPFDYLKIDGEFIRQLVTSEVDRVIVRSIVASARPLGKQTIAEYVGDEATLCLLREYGVDHAQGYYVGRPVEPTLPLGPREGRTAAR